MPAEPAAATGAAPARTTPARSAGSPAGRTSAASAGPVGTFTADTSQPCSKPRLARRRAEACTAPICTLPPSGTSCRPASARRLRPSAPAAPSCTATVLADLVAFQRGALDHHHQRGRCPAGRAPPRRPGAAGTSRYSGVMRSMKKSGRNSSTTASASSGFSHQRLRTRNQFIVTAAKISMATVQATTTLSSSDRAVDVDQQQLRVEDPDEGQDHGAQRIDARPGCRSRSASSPRDGRRGEGGQAHRRRDVAHDPVVEDEQVHRDQRDHQPALRAQLHHHRRHQRGHQHVVGRGRHAQAEHQADEGDEQQHRHHVALRDELDELGHAQAQAGERDAADDDAGGGGGHADADHVARAVVQAADHLVRSRRSQVSPSGCRRSSSISGRCVSISTISTAMAQKADSDGRHLLDHQAPDQRADRASGSAGPARTVGQVSSGCGLSMSMSSGRSGQRAASRHGIQVQRRPSARRWPRAPPRPAATLMAANSVVQRPPPR